jgi:hypothetical protein
MTDPTYLLTAARAEALFVSDLSTTSHPTSAEVTATIRRVIRTHHGSRGCATVLAGEYGEHPETAAPRMRWALGVAQAVYAKRPQPRSSHVLLAVLMPVAALPRRKGGTTTAPHHYGGI